MLFGTEIAKSLQELFPNMVRTRRYLHQHPELSFQEKKTSAWIATELEAMGCTVQRNVGGHGLIVNIAGNTPGPTVALRADIDALPIQDEKISEYSSVIPNVMHACGHDGHTSTLLAIASFYSSNRAHFAGIRRLLFQPAEEVTPGGALPMIKDGALNDVDVIYGVHLWTPLPFGQVASRAGAFMSAADEFTLEITGQGGHGGLPHQATDAIVVGSSIVQSVQSIVSRNVNPLHPAVVTIGSFQAGSTNNIIAEKCRMKGTVRSFDEDTRLLVHQRLDQIIKHTCDMYGAAYEYQMRIGYPPVVNDSLEVDRFFKIAGEVFGEESVIQSDAITVAEDFAYYLQRVPGCFMFVGAGNKDCGAAYSHHHPKFDIDERSMLTAAKLLINLAEDYVIEQR